MRAIHAILTIGLFLAGALSSNAAAAEDEIQSFSRGASLYSANCGRCHNPRGPGEYSDGHWPLIVTHMRVIGGLPGDQARAIQAFLLASNNPPARAMSLHVPSGRSGMELVQSYGCRGCHRIGGEGGTIGPSLENLFQRRDEDWVMDQIQRPRAHNPKTVMPELGISDADAGAIIEALRRME